MNRHCDTEGQEDYFDHGELHCEARHRLVPRHARDLLPFIPRKSPSKTESDLLHTHVALCLVSCHAKLCLWLWSMLRVHARNILVFLGRMAEDMGHALHLDCTCQGLDPCERIESKNSTRRWVTSPALDNCNRSCTFFLKRNEIGQLRGCYYVLAIFW
jgi:hypothetical protein